MQRRYQFADFCQYYHKFRSFPTTAAPARRVPSDEATSVCAARPCGAAGEPVAVTAWLWRLTTISSLRRQSRPSASSAARQSL